VSTISSTGGAGTPAASARAAGLTSAADQEDRFMKLLVAQMKNQDPLNPMDNAQMTSQVAQINTVGGIEKLNTTVASLLSAFQAVQAQSAMQLPGRDVLVAGPSLALAGGSATGGVDLAADAASVRVDILDAAGQVVQTLPLGASGAGVRSFTWDGKAADGSPLADGSWRMRVTATDAQGKAVAATALTAARVQSVSQRDGAVQLDLGPAGSRAWSDIHSFL
jgi:flagellar basal-body rod modification protein FlgD